MSVRTLFFCGGCSILISQQELETLDDCPNCNESYDEKIPGVFTDENASKLETAATDQTQ